MRGDALDINAIRMKHGNGAARDFFDSAETFEPPPDEDNGANAEKPPPDGEPSSSTVKVTATTWVWRGPESIVRRKWLCSTHYIRGSVTSTIGKRGGGKTNRAIVETISMTTGRDLLCTGNMPDRPQRVWYIGEDTRDEIERRIVAACAHYGIKENDQEMDEVMTILVEIAADADASVEFLHHTRKQSAGNASTVITADDARGADAITAGPRDVRIVNAMTGKEAADFGIPEGEAWRYSRIDDGKQNLKPPGKAVWGISMSYLLPCGDSVGVLQPWNPPKTFDGITKADAQVAQRLAQGGAFRASAQAKDWFGYALGERLNLDPRNNPAHKAKLKAMIKIWLKTKVLREEPGVSGSRHKKTFIVPGPTNLYQHDTDDKPSSQSDAKVAQGDASETA
jgi:hypothetical protein